MAVGGETPEGPWRWYWLQPVIDDGEGTFQPVEADENFHLHQPIPTVEL